MPDRLHGSLWPIVQWLIQVVENALAFAAAGIDDACGGVHRPQDRGYGRRTGDPEETGNELSSVHAILLSLKRFGTKLPMGTEGMEDR